MLTGKASILDIIKAIDKKAIIRKDKNTIPEALKLDCIFKVCLTDIIKEAKIQNCVRNTIKRTRSGVTAKNLKRPGEWAYPTAIKTFLNGILFSLSGNIFTPIT